MKDKLRRFHQKKRNEVHWPHCPFSFGCYSKNIPQCNESIYIYIYGVRLLWSFLSAGNGIITSILLIVNIKWECAFIHQEKRIICIYICVWFLPLGEPNESSRQQRLGQVKKEKDKPAGILSNMFETSIINSLFRSSRM